MECVIKLLRKEFDYRCPLTVAQVLSRIFAILLITCYTVKCKLLSAFSFFVERLQIKRSSSVFLNSKAEGRIWYCISQVFARGFAEKKFLFVHDLIQVNTNNLNYRLKDSFSQSLKYYYPLRLIAMMIEHSFQIDDAYS